MTVVMMKSRMVQHQSQLMMKMKISLTMLENGFGSFLAGELTLTMNGHQQQQCHCEAEKMRLRQTGGDDFAVAVVVESS